MRASDHPAWLPLRKARDAQESLRDAATVWDRYRSTKGSAFGYRYEYSEAESRLSYRAQIPTLDGAAALERLTRHAVQDARSALSNLVYILGEAAGASLSSLKNNDFPIVDDAPGWSDRRLRDLPTETVAKIRAVQPFAQAAPQLTHPLTYLRSLSNADKHHRGLRVGLIPAPPLGQSLLTTLQLTIPVEDLEVSESLRIEPQDLRLEPGPFFDGDIVFSVNLPQGRDWRAMEADDLNLPLELALFSAVDPEPGLTPVLPSIGNAVRFVSGCIRFITGVVDSPPRPFTSDHLSGPSESA